MTHTDNGITLIPQTPGQVAKSLVYVALTAGGLLVSARADKTVTLDEIITIVIVVVGLIPVYFLRGTEVKTSVAFVLAALNALNVIFIGGVAGFGSVTLDDWILIGIQAFAAIGIAVVPNSPPPAALDSSGRYDVSSLPPADVDGALN